MRACTPAPKTATVAASSRARRSAANPPTAPVRSAVSQVPSISASVRPVTGSTTSTTAWMTGSPRSAFSGLTDTTFAPIDSEPARWAGMKRLTPWRVSTAVRSGAVALPSARALKAVLMTSMAAGMSIDARTSAADRILICMVVGMAAE